MNSAEDEGEKTVRINIDAATIALRLVASGFFFFGIWICWRAQSMRFYTLLGPGPGFFPMWTGLLMIAMSVATLGGSLIGKARELSRTFLPRSGAARTMAVTVAMIVAFATLVDPLGFLLTVFGMLTVLFRTYGCRIFPTAICLAVIASLSVAYIFVNWFGLPLPPTPGGVLHFIRL